MKRIRLAVAGLGNCASSLIQGIDYYRTRGAEDCIGLMHYDIGGYRPGDIDVVAAFDVDSRKVGRDISEAVFASPNCTQVFNPHVSFKDVTVKMGPVMDGVAPHMKDYPLQDTFSVARQDPCDVVRELEKSEAEVLINYMPVGSEQATRFYAQSALDAGVAFINCMPVFIASDPVWANRFEQKRVPIVGDDIKSQIGATIVHRTLTKLFMDRGCHLDRTYQLNVGGNTDFLNMLSRERLKSKKISKTEAVQSVLDENPLAQENIHIGPCDYIPWQKDNKICFLRMEGRIFGDVPINLELRLSVEDSPNSGGCTIDAIRVCKLALERGIGGPLLEISAYTMKHPPVQFPDEMAREMVERFISGEPGSSQTQPLST
ncbi:MAG: Myo-inositol-1-phosphate synthase [Methanosaeta sp. PtaB.Bin039]|nr:MAG: Myo-inositol-1-phosphate synthase [Methanosaeta sp. PtaB.Bin039]OPY47646.1 MAG: Myo-inositol-1-phosphate synthase [Methanosaeta sp. PtaU1.Bin028]HOT07799.1 inositol-3-phosphate synthase [Methanotrichaceae archaeon]HQF16403.1 inositol-3-phosphate synthase [Methanotrichaceae archaeon]HQI90983.1 inositol-3-phosphate synthase [Methanotrichaceae archaeon]